MNELLKINHSLGMENELQAKKLAIAGSDGHKLFNIPF